MSSVETVEVGGKQYNIPQASAVDQKRLLTLVGARIAFNKATSGAEIDRDMLFGALLATPEEQLDKIAAIVLGRCMVAGSDRVVDIKDFQGSIQDYMMLIAEGIKVNLDGFFTYLNNAASAPLGETGAQLQAE